MSGWGRKGRAREVELSVTLILVGAEKTDKQKQKTDKGRQLRHVWGNS